MGNPIILQQLSGAAPTWDALYKLAEITSTANTTITLENVATPDGGVLLFVQGGTHTLALEAGGTTYPVTVQSGAGKVTVVQWVYTGSGYRVWAVNAADAAASGPALSTTNRVGYWTESDMVKSGGKVTSWPENSGNGKDWTAVSTVEPTDAGADGLQSVNPQQMTLATPISFTSAFSLYFWIKRTGDGTMLSAGSGSYYAYMDGTSVQSKFNSSAGASTNNNAVPTGAWKVVCITYSGVDGDYPKLYVDGTLVGSYGGGNVYMGSGYTIANLLGANAGINFDGYLKRLAVYSVEHTASDVSDNTTALTA